MKPHRSSSFVLIADDNPTNLEILELILTGEGIDTILVSNGEMALEQVHKEPPDLILLDGMMPVMDGFETCERLKADPTTHDIPVIFMTALSEVSSKVRALRMGAVDYIVKPFEREEALARVKTHLALRSMTRALEEKNTHLEAEVRERLAAQQRLAALARELERELAERARTEAAQAALKEEIIAMQNARLHELSTPLIPINAQVMVMPLIGTLDVARAQLALETALQGVEKSRARFVIIDITGVKQVDASVASTLISTAAALRLLGARAVITGIRPDVAQTLVRLGADLEEIVTRSTLENGIAYAMSSLRARPARGHGFPPGAR